MKSVQQWLDEYGESHQNATNKAFHWVCVPLIMLSLVGLLWSIPTPESWATFAFPLNWGSIFVVGMMLYYMFLSFPLALGMVVVGAGLIYGNYFLVQINPFAQYWQFCLAIFALAWVGQFIGHKIEGKKPSFLEDVQYLLIGPMWLLSFIYRSLGISY